MKDGAAGEVLDLEEEALLLLATTTDLPESIRAEKLRSWRQMSAAHARALERVEGEWALFGRVPSEPMSLWQQSRLQTQLILASAVDHPRYLTCALSAVIAVLLWTVLPQDQNMERLAAVPSSGTAENYMQGERWGAAVAYSTARGEQREIDLSDGSKLLMNWNTEIRLLDIAEEIHIDMIVGDILVSSADGRDAAIVVHAGNALAHSNNAEFAIHSHSREDAFFQVRKGVLKIAGADRGIAREVSAAQEVFYARGVGGHLDEANIDAIAAWRNGELIFDEQPLTEALWELAHFTDRPMRVGPIAVGDTAITATYALTEANAAVLQLADAYDLELVAESDATLLVRSIDLRRL